MIPEQAHTREEMKLARNKHSDGWWLAVMVGLLLLGLFPKQAGSDAFRELIPDDPIPQNQYTGWSLFLICNLNWLEQENDKRLDDLYTRFTAYGQTIGRNHLAVWFWTRSPHGKSATPLHKAVDAQRSSLYCEKFKLLPSESPYVLVTTMHPDLPDSIAGDKVIVALNGHPSTDIGSLLSEVVNQLLVKGLNQAEIDSEAYWLAWKRTFETIYESGASFFKQVKVTIDAKFVKVEIGGAIK
jgi:hypothetical protein